MKNVFLLFTTFLLGCFISNATTHKVGSTRLYKTPNALYLAHVIQDGDTIEIDSETFTGKACLAVWQADNLYIKGVGTEKSHMKANGMYIWGKGIWVFAGDNITVENIEFSEASVPDKNGAGIRLDGIGMSVKKCYFHDNENGILTGNTNDGDILIEYSEFNNNGYGDGYSHNLYIGHVNKLTFRFNYSHHAYIGHNLKSRADENFILYNRIMDEQTGKSSRLIDLPNGGFSIVQGNLLMQGANAENNNLVGYGLEGLNNTLSEFYFINNTLVNKRTASCLFVSIATATSVANISNNIFTGTGTIINGTTTAMTNNIIDPVIANLNFIDEVNYDYHINSNSSAVNAGISVNSVNGYSLTPDTIYEHPTSSSSRTISTIIDAGAYEYNDIVPVPTPTPQVPIKKLLVFPNPFINKITLENIISDKLEVSVFNLLGQNFSHFISVSYQDNNVIIDTENLDKGIYIIQTNLFSKIMCKK